MALLFDLLFDRRRQERKSAAEAEAARMVNRYGSVEMARQRCDELIAQHDDRNKIRFLSLVRDNLT